MDNQLQVIDPKEYGLEKTQADKMTSGLSIILEERKALEEIYSNVITKELNAETLKEARELRLKVQKNRTTGIEDWHKTNKAFYLAGGRFVDAYKNKEVIVNQQMEAKLMEIEKHFENLEKERKANLAIERKELLLPYEVDVTYLPLEDMSDETFAQLLADSKLLFETKQEAAKKAESERLEAERLAEEKRQAELKSEQDRIEAQRVENERLKKESEKREAELAEKEAIHKKRFAEMQPMAIMFRDFEAVIGLPEEEYQKQLAEHKIGYQQHLEFQHEQEIKKQAEAEKIERGRIKAETEAKKLKLENDRLKAEQEKEHERIEAEEKERVAKEKALANAGDKEKVKHFFSTFKTIEFPELTSEDGKKMAVRVKEALALVKQLIIEDSKNLL